MTFVNALAGDVEHESGRAQGDDLSALRDHVGIDGRWCVKVSNDGVGIRIDSHRIRPRSRPKARVPARTRRGDRAQLLGFDHREREFVSSTVIECANRNALDPELFRDGELVREALSSQHDLATSRVLVRVGDEIDAHARSLRGRNVAGSSHRPSAVPMTAASLLALWSLAGPIQPADVEGVVWARVDQVARLSVEERRRFILSREPEAAPCRQKGRIRTWLMH
jgi:hypothetical protein